MEILLKFSSIPLQDEGDCSGIIPFYASTDICIPDSQDLAKLYAQIDHSGSNQQQQQQQQPNNPSSSSKGSPPQSLPQDGSLWIQHPSASTSVSRSVSIDTVTVRLKELNRNGLVPVEKLGEGQFGEIHLCRMKDQETRETRLVAVKSLSLIHI